MWECRVFCRASPRMMSWRAGGPPHRLPADRTCGARRAGGAANFATLAKVSRGDESARTACCRGNSLRWPSAMVSSRSFWCATRCDGFPRFSLWQHSRSRLPVVFRGSIFVCNLLGRIGVGVRVALQCWLTLHSWRMGGCRVGGRSSRVRSRFAHARSTSRLQGRKRSMHADYADPTFASRR
jgi:hypothetical protein